MTLHTYTTPAGATVEARDREEIGLRFGRYVVIGHSSPNKTRNRRVVCRCDCGTVKTVPLTYLRNGRSRSCGCYSRDQLIRRNYRHGQTDTSTYQIWRGMIGRCRARFAKKGERYAARGISVCDRWCDYENFLADMGERPDAKASLGRIDNDGDYCPENCRRETRTQQNRNTSRNHFIEFQGQRKTLSEWAERLGMHHTAILGRLRRGWTTEEAVSRPVDERSRNKRGSPLPANLRGLEGLRKAMEGVK